MTYEIDMKPPNQFNSSWTILSKELGSIIAASGGTGGYNADFHVKMLIDDMDPNLIDHIEFDSDYECFYAYIDTEENANKLAKLINDEVNEVARVKPPPLLSLREGIISAYSTDTGIGMVSCGIFDFVFDIEDLVIINPEFVNICVGRKVMYDHVGHQMTMIAHNSHQVVA